MSKFVANVLKAIGSLSSAAGTNACVIFFFDEPECPKSMLK